MTNDELAELLRDCPVLYHMAERGSWGSIRRHGLLSTSALLELFEVAGEEREGVEARRRPESVIIEHPSFGRAVVRDQKPMDDAGLRRSLQGDLTPEDWYRLLNARVFMWMSRARLVRLLMARSYRNLEHDVLELDAALVVAAYREQITLSPINSGVTSRFPQHRGKDTFSPIPDYPYARWRKTRKVGERVVEFAVTGGIPDIERFVRRVVVMRGEEVVTRYE
jgi:hypothetical protein